MDRGPVDAGPNDGEHKYLPSRPESPEHRFLDTPRAAGFRSSSMQRSHTRERSDEVDVSQDVEPSRERSHHRTLSSESAASFHDRPSLPRVGATPEEINGEICVDDHDTHLRIESEAASGSTEVRDQTPHRMVKFTLYETNQRYWITGGDISDKKFRLLRIDRTFAPGQIALFEDKMVYDRRGMNRVLASIDEGNKVTGGLRMKYSFWGLLGFIRFTEAHYMLIITKRQQVALIGGHYVYQVEHTELVPLTTGSSSRFVRDRNPEETRFLGILGNLDLSKSFYFSYTYDITRSLQENIIRQRQALAEGHRRANSDFNAMFVWNHHLLRPAMTALKQPAEWCLPIIHGYIDQAPLDIFGRCVYLTIIGRRSRHFAGARFLKRGINDAGFVANDVETEQIVAEKLTTSFHAPGPRLYANPTYTSYLQHRGSIPLFWTQDTSTVTPKPDIKVNLTDPFHQPAALHFDNLFERYGCPVYVLNLIKARERVPRESKLLQEYENCIEYLNQSLPPEKKIVYRAYDMARASKGRNTDVMAELAEVARDILTRTGFFQNGEEGFDEPRVQNGIARTNCIDCLDRTNSAQFVIGKHAFALQLKALGVYEHDELEYDTDAVNLFTQMFHNHGDTMAMQYGGSHLVNTVNTYRKLNHWQSSSRDMVENIKRYYNNSFLDTQRQEAYNLFLGNYVWAQGQPMLWDLSTDYYLHHSDPKAWLERNSRNYIQWYTPEYLEPRTMPPRTLRSPDDFATTPADVSDYDSYWLECYRPGVVSSIAKVYTYRMTAESRYLPDRSQRDRDANKHNFDFSPFVPRLDPHRHSAGPDSPEKRPPRKGVKIIDPQDEPSVPDSASARGTAEASHRRPNVTEDGPMPGILRSPTFERESGPLPKLPSARQSLTASSHHPVKAADKAQMHLWSLNQFLTQALNPSVSDPEAREYERYIAHPLNLPLVVSTELPSDANRDYVAYVRKAGGCAYNLAHPVRDHHAFDNSTNLYDDAADADVHALGDGGGIATSESDLSLFQAFASSLPPDALNVTEQDSAKKRYKAYGQWLRGKSLFKQSKVDPEFRSGMT